MKHFRRHLLSSAVVISVLAMATMAMAQEPRVKQKLPDVQQLEKLRPGINVRGVCPDPAAQRIDFSIVSKTSQFKGRVRITGVIKNVGKGAYESGPNQQGMHLYSGPTLVANKNFGNLASGQEATVTYERDWDASSPSEGEFPAMFKLVISYDPDILMDNNLKNDDCNGNNNVIERSGKDINAMFKQK